MREGTKKKGSEELALAVPAEGRERRLGSGRGRLPAAVEKKGFLDLNFLLRTKAKRFLTAEVHRMRFKVERTVTQHLRNRINSRTRSQNRHNRQKASFAESRVAHPKRAGG